MNEVVYEKYKSFKKINHEVEVNKENGETILKIYNRDKLRINSIKINSKDDFKRNYTFYRANENGERLETVHRGEVYNLNLEQFKAEDTTIQIEDALESYLASEYIQIVIEDRDNYPINIEYIEISYYIDKMVFKSKDSNKIYLLFDNDEATAPDYDISAYIEEIEKQIRKTLLY